MPQVPLFNPISSCYWIIINLLSQCQSPWINVDQCKDYEGHLHKISRILHPAWHWFISKHFGYILSATMKQSVQPFSPFISISFSRMFCYIWYTPFYNPSMTDNPLTNMKKHQNGRFEFCFIHTMQTETLLTVTETMQLWILESLLLKLFIILNFCRNLFVYAF